MADDFTYDVFLSQSPKDKAIVRAVAERLRADGLRVWYYEWELRRGDNIPAKIEEGLEHSRVLMLCMSRHAFGSDWAQLEAGTFRFRDPLNKQRRFIPLRLDAAPIKGSLAQFLYINWWARDSEQTSTKLLEACRPPAEPSAAEATVAGEQGAEKAIQLDYTVAVINANAFSSDKKGVLTVLTGSSDKTVRLWDVDTGHCLRTLKDHTESVQTVAWSTDDHRALSGSEDETARLWDVGTGRCLRVLEGHTGYVQSVAWSVDQRRVLMRFNELRETLQLRLSGEFTRFADDELRAVVGLLAGPGIVWELKFGSWVLLQPERINAYAQAVIQTMRADEHERGCLPEERVLNGDLTYHSSIARLEADEERFVLLAMHQTLVERGLCLRDTLAKARCWSSRATTGANAPS